LAGVCGGLGRYTDIDPLVFRVTLAVLAFFGGVGVLVYGLAWLLIPDEGATESEGERLVHGRADRSAVAAIVAVLVGLGIFGGFIGNGLNTTALILFGVLGVGLVVAVREGGSRAEWWASAGAQHGMPAAGQPGATGGVQPGGQPGSAATGQPTVTAPAPGAAGSTPTWMPAARPGTAPTQPMSAYRPTYPPPPRSPYHPPYVPPAPRPPKQRSALGGLTISLAVIVAGVISSIALWANGEVDFQVVLAGALLVLGAGLIVGGWLGRARWLIVVGSVVTLLLVTTATWSLPIKGGIGNRIWEPTTVEQLQSQSPYALAAGQAELDLTKIHFPLGETTPVKASVGVGELTVRVPEDVNVTGHAHVGMGNILLVTYAGRTAAGERIPDPESNTEGIDVDKDIDIRSTANTTIELDLKVGTGQIQVIQEPEGPVAVPAPEATRSGSR
jgi:phage shock protein PspC (stress-responsive transcriptional regulator)